MNHPIHPALVHFPIACWTLATIGDYASIWWKGPVWWVAGLLLIIGTVAAIAAMISGLFELRKVTDENNALCVIDSHVLLALLTWALYAASLGLRIDKFQLSAPGPLELTLSGLAFISLFGAGWYGGKLVYESGVGVKKL